MAVALSDSQAQDFLSRYPIDSGKLGRHGLYIRDGSRFVLAYAVAGGNVGLMDVSPQANALGISDMTDGDIRQVEVTPGQVQETSIFDIIAQIPDNVTYDPSLLTEGATSVADAVSNIASEVGKDVGKVAGGIGQGLSDIKIFGLPLPVLLLIAVGGYVTFLMWPAIVGRRS